MERLTFSALWKIGAIRRIAFSTFVQYFSKVVQLVLGVLTVKMLSGFFSITSYGFYGSVIEYALFFSMAANLGIFANSTRAFADDHEHGKVFVSALVTRVVTAAAFFVLAFFVGILTSGSPVFLSCLLFFLVSLFLDQITSICDAYLQATYHMGRASVALIAGRVCNFLVMFFLVKYFGSAAMVERFSQIHLFFLAPLIASVVTVGLSLYFVRERLPFTWHFNKSLAWKIFYQSLPFGAINILNSLYFRFLPDYLVHQWGGDSKFASFMISFKIAEVLSLISTFFMYSVLSSMREALVKKDFAWVRKMYRISFWTCAGLGICVVVFGSLFGPKIISLVTHEKYVLMELYFVLPLLLSLTAISYLYDVLLLTMFACGKDLLFLKGECLAFISAGAVFIFSLFLTDPFWKLFTIIMGAITGEAVIVLFGIFHIRKILLFNESCSADGK